MGRTSVLIVGSVLLLGCPGEGTMGEDTDTDEGSAGSTTGVSTTVSPSSTAPGEGSTSDDPVTSGVEGTGTSTGPESTSSGTTSTGCPLGAQGCGCDDGDCDTGLECSEDDICEPIPACSELEEESEPNDDEDSAPDGGDLGDSNPTFQEVEGVLDGETQEDWYNWHCNDTPIGQFEMNHEIEAEEIVRVCMYLDCDNGNDPTLDCPEDSVADTSPGGRLGCCTTETELSVVDFSCNDDGDDDSAEVYVVVADAPEDSCLAYTLGFHC
jgi:hypothetical protein